MHNFHKKRKNLLTPSSSTHNPYHSPSKNPDYALPADPIASDRRYPLMGVAAAAVSRTYRSRRPKIVQELPPIPPSRSCCCRDDGDGVRLRGRRDASPTAQVRRRRRRPHKRRTVRRRRRRRRRQQDS